MQTTQRVTSKCCHLTSIWYYFSLAIKTGEGVGSVWSCV